MPKFTCTCCGELTYFPSGDEALQEARGFACGECWTVIHSGRYPKHFSGPSIFGPCGPGLGDHLFLWHLSEQFARLNPSTRVHLLGPENEPPPNDPGRLIFWPDNAPIPAPSGAITIPLANEVAAFARDGYFPRWDRLEEMDLDPRAYVVLALRHIDRCSDKNVTPEEADKLYEFLGGLVKRGDIAGGILVGNDSELEMSWLPPWLIDQRGKLTLEQIAWLSSRAMLTIGKDSGLMHLAAAAGGYAVGWGYRTKNWRMLAAEGRAVSIMDGPSWFFQLAEAVASMIWKRQITVSAQYLPKRLPKWFRQYNGIKCR